MAVEVATKADLEAMKQDLLHAIAELKGSELGQPFLRTAEVCRILGLGKTALQTLRSSGELRFYKRGATVYYEYADVLAYVRGSGESE